MNLMFWNKKTKDDAEDSPEKYGDRDASRELSDREPGDRDLSEDGQQKSGVSSIHLKRRLVIGAAIGLLVFAAIGVVTWKISRPSPNKNATNTVAAPSVTQSTHFPDKQLISLPPIALPQLIKSPSADHQVDVEALRKKNEALQSQVKTLKAKPPQAETISTKQAGGEVKTHAGTLQAESLEIKKVQAQQNQAKIDALVKKNIELQSQIGALKAELPKIEKAQAKQHQANIDAITRKNSELQAKIEALKKMQKKKNIASPSIRGGEIAIGNKKPKAAAMSLKEAIEAMNAGSRAPPDKVTK